MANNPTSVYWDSCVYLDFLRGGHPNQAHLRAVLKDWEAGKVTLVTSTLTIAEVLYVPGVQPAVRLDESRREDLIDLFRPTGDRELTLVELTRPIAEAARDLCWSRGVARRTRCTWPRRSQQAARSCTHDERLQNKSRQVGGDPILEVAQPVWTWQTDMEIP